MATLSPFERARITPMLERSCSRRTVQADTPRLRFTFTIRGTTITLMEERALQRSVEDWIVIPYAQFRRAPSSSMWMLHYSDKHMRWILFESIPASKRLDFLLQIVEENPNGCFSG